MHRAGRLKIDFFVKRLFCQEYLRVDVSVFSITCELDTPYVAFFQYLYFSKFCNGKCGNIQEETPNTHNVALYSPRDLIVMRVCCKDFPQ